MKLHVSLHHNRLASVSGFCRQKHPLFLAPFLVASSLTCFFLFFFLFNHHLPHLPHLPYRHHLFLFFFFLFNHHHHHRFILPLLLLPRHHSNQCFHFFIRAIAFTSSLLHLVAAPLVSALKLLQLPPLSS